jgi:hypothetical protein
MNNIERADWDFYCATKLRELRLAIESETSYIKTCNQKAAKGDRKAAENMTAASARLTGYLAEAEFVQKMADELR